MQTGRAFGQAAERGVVASLFGAIVCLTAGAASAEGPVKLAGSQLEPLKWSELAGWTGDDHLAAFAAYQASCQALRKMRRSEDRATISEALANVCRKAVGLRPANADAARVFFEQNFQPVRIARLGEAAGLVTGYFEPIVAGSRFPSPEFPVPLYRRPRDLVADGYKPGSLAFPNKGVRISRRNENNELVPYHDRGAIEAGALDGQKLEICWIKDPLDLLTIQIEGSARVILEDGTPLRVSYDSHNGYSYSSVERAFIERNLIPRKETSTQRMREWMAAHPDEAASIRAANRSYMFFRVTGLSNDGEPVGAQGVPLTPGRSIAVDRVHEYGTPFFIEANLPIEGGKPASPFRRLMIAQDTGSAIVGPARADLYWGAGDDAGRIAGRIRHSGRFVMLLPRELDMVVAGTQMPLPVPKPKIAGVEVKEDGKGKADSTNAGETTGRQKPPPASKPKTPAVEVKKQDSKGKTESASVGETTGRQKPLPVVKPNTLAAEVKKQAGKGKTESASVGETTGRQKPSLASKPKAPAVEVKKQDDKGKTESAHAGETSGKQKATPVAKTKTPAVEVKKQDGKGKAESAKAAETTGNQKPLPASKPKTPAVEAKKQDGKGKAQSAKAAETTGNQKPLPASKPKTPTVEAKKQSGKGKAESAGSEEKTPARPDRQASSARKSSRSLY
jgi:membrane-bound lytic murein transglycosylase A